VEDSISDIKMVRGQSRNGPVTSMVLSETETYRSRIQQKKSVTKTPKRTRKRASGTPGVRGWRKRREEQKPYSIAAHTDPPTSESTAKRKYWRQVGPNFPRGSFVECIFARTLPACNEDGGRDSCAGTRRDRRLNWQISG